MPKQMTDADELAIWREIGEAYRNNDCRTKDEIDFYPSAHNWHISINRGWSIFSGKSLPQLIFDYRQRLAEEREAKKSPREKRLEKIVGIFASGYSDYWMVRGNKVSQEDIAEALKED